MHNEQYLNYIHFYGIWFYCFSSKPIKKFNPVRAMESWTPCEHENVRTEKDFRNWVKVNEKDLILNKVYPYCQGPRCGGNGSRPVKITSNYKKII